MKRPVRFWLRPARIESLERSYENIKLQLKERIPTERHELVPTDPIRWEDVLSGKVRFYKE